MTMLHHTDTDDASYLELAEFLSTYGEADHIARNLEELFTRVVFNIATANRDDHLRNHGFIRSRSEKQSMCCHLISITVSLIFRLRLRLPNITE